MSGFFGGLGGGASTKGVAEIDRLSGMTGERGAMGSWLFDLAVLYGNIDMLVLTDVLPDDILATSLKQSSNKTVKNII